MSTESVSPPRRLTVLLAEDDELNQMLSVSIFKRIGWHLDIVDNGALVIEKLKQGAYDLVLMDVQMPVMDGYETTRKIRSELSSPAGNIPIIAVTAHAQQSEIDKCRIVGMNDYIYKPFKPDELIAKILALVDGDRKVNVVQKKDEVESGEVINLKSLYLTCANSPDIVKNVLGAFLAETPLRMTEIKQLFEAEDWAGFQVICHKMKSSFALVGAEAIRKALEEMEHDCANNNIDKKKFRILVDSVLELSLRAEDEIKKEISAH